MHVPKGLSGSLVHVSEERAFYATETQDVKCPAECDATTREMHAHLEADEGLLLFCRESEVSRRMFNSEINSDPCLFCEANGTEWDTLKGTRVEKMASKSMSCSPGATHILLSLSHRAVVEQARRLVRRPDRTNKSLLQQCDVHAELIQTCLTEKSPPLWGSKLLGGKASDWSRIQNPAF